MMVLRYTLGSRSMVNPIVAAGFRDNYVIGRRQVCHTCRCEQRPHGHPLSRSPATTAGDLLGQGHPLG